MKQVTIKNDCISLTVLDYGAIIQKILFRNKDNVLTNVVVGFENPEEYLTDSIFLGACVGRYAGRISNGGFNIKGKNYAIHQTDGIHLHGGLKGFGKKYWSIDKVIHDSEPSIQLSYKSAALEEGYPGALKVELEYKLVGKSLQIVHRATTDETTVINLTNHSYFRLDNNDNIDHYLMQLKSNRIVETQDNLLPTGNILQITGLDFDFQQLKPIRSIPLDTPYILNAGSGVVASLFSPISGISIKLRTNQPAVVVYRPPDFPALCFETQNYPDAPNHNNFPSALLNPGETYNNTAIFDFDLVI